jgi:hypothetical protein
MSGRPPVSAADTETSAPRDRRQRPHKLPHNRPLAQSGRG